MNDPNVEIITLDWTEALLAYAFDVPGHAEAELSGPEGRRRFASSEAGEIGRLHLDGLRPEAAYTVDFHHPGGDKQLRFTTPPPPEGPLLAHLVLIADPHLSLRKENRKGRFFVESAQILADVTEQTEALAPDAAVLPGDLTNHGEPAEYRRAAAILNRLTCPRLPLPGNHDFVHPDGAAAWSECFGPLTGELSPGPARIVGLDTSGGVLTDRDAVRLTEAAARPGLLLIATHYQLFDHPRVCRGGGAKTVANRAAHAALLDRLAARDATVIYAGHQNVPAHIMIGRCLQVNLPQPTQYPCGFTRVRVFANGLYHTFVPIASEVFRQWSRRSGDLAAAFYREDQWESVYRRGDGAAETNFFHPLNLEPTGVTR